MAFDPHDTTPPIRDTDVDTPLLASVRAALATPAATPLVAHLEQRFLRHSLPPSASDAALRHLEGQRSVILYLNHLVATARRGASGDLAR